MKEYLDKTTETPLDVLSKKAIELQGRTDIFKRALKKENDLDDFNSTQASDDEETTYRVLRKIGG